MEESGGIFKLSADEYAFKNLLEDQSIGEVKDMVNVVRKQQGQTFNVENAQPRPSAARERQEEPEQWFCKCFMIPMTSPFCGHCKVPTKGGKM